jgi:tetratricopeptide (TPR) repeat protein
MKQISFSRQTVFTSSLSLICAWLAAGCAHQPRDVASLGSAPTAFVVQRAPDAEAPSAEKLRTEGVQAYTEGNFPRAATLMQTALALDPQFGELWPRFLIFYSALVTGDYAHALSQAEVLANEMPYQPLVYQQLGLAHLGLGNAKAAAEAFQKALDFESHAPRVHFYLGIAQGQLNQPKEQQRAFQEAQREYQDILRFNPRDFLASYELAALFLFRNIKIEEVGQLLENARESLTARAQEELPMQRPLYTNFYLPLLEGIYAFRKNDLELAQSRLSGALAHIPAGAKADAAELYFYLGKTNLGLHQETLAKPLLSEALSLDPHGAYAKEADTAIRGLAAQ